MKSAGSRFGQLIKLVFILGILVVVALAVVPLKLYYSQVNDYLKPISLEGISGSAVKGQAEKLSYRSLPMGQSEWLLYPTSYNSLGGQVRLSKKEFDLTLDIKKMKQNSMVIEQLTGFIDWQLIKPFIQMRFGQISAYAQLNLNQMVYDKNDGLQQLSGEIKLKDFKLIQPSLKDLGEVTLSFETQKKGIIVGQFSSQSTALAVSGSLFIQPHKWQLNLDIIPKAGHFELDAVFNSVGDARKGGGRRLNLAGFY